MSEKFENFREFPQFDGLVDGSKFEVFDDQSCGEFVLVEKETGIAGRMEIGGVQTTPEILETWFSFEFAGHVWSPPNVYLSKFWNLVKSVESVNDGSPIPSKLMEKIFSVARKEFGV